MNVKFFPLYANLNRTADSLDRCAVALEAISRALLRLSPDPLPVPATDVPPSVREPLTMSHSESAGDYEARQQEANRLALAFGVAPNTPAFRKAMEEFEHDQRMLHTIRSLQSKADANANAESQEVTGDYPPEIDWETTFRQAVAGNNERR